VSVTASHRTNSLFNVQKKKLLFFQGNNNYGWRNICGVVKMNNFYVRVQMHAIITAL